MDYPNFKELMKISLDDIYDENIKVRYNDKGKNILEYLEDGE